MGIFNGEEILGMLLGGGGGFIECDELPTADISRLNFYLTPNGLYWYNGKWNKVLNKNDKSDIAVAAKGSSSNPDYVPGIPGLMQLYNDSTGLRIDGNGNLCIAQAKGANGESENNLLLSIPQAQRSVNRPITPSNLEYALKNFIPAVTYQSDIPATSTDDKSAASVGSVVRFVANQLLNAIQIKRARINAGEKYTIKPGTLMLVKPRSSIDIYGTDGEKLLSGGGVTLIMATDRYNPKDNSVDDTMSATGSHYSIASISLNGISTTAPHNIYQITSSTGDKFCYLQSKSGDQGLTYIYYIGF